jgi:hypothetical protein
MNRGRCRVGPMGTGVPIGPEAGRIRSRRLGGTGEPGGPGLRRVCVVESRVSEPRRRSFDPALAPVAELGYGQTIARRKGASNGTQFFHDSSTKPACVVPRASRQIT